MILFFFSIFPSFLLVISILEHIIHLQRDLPAILSVYREFVSTLQNRNIRLRPGVGTSVNSRKTIYSRLEERFLPA